RRIVATVSVDGEDLLGEPATGARHHPPFEGEGDAIFWEGRNPCPVPMVLANGIRLIARMVHGELLMLIGLSVLWGGCAVGVMGLWSCGTFNCGHAANARQRTLPMPLR